MSWHWFGPRRRRRRSGRRRASAAAPRFAARRRCAAAAASRSRLIRRVALVALAAATGRPWKMRGELTMAAVTGALQRHLDHFEAEARRVRIVGAAVLAAGHFVGRAHAGRARHVDVRRWRRRRACGTTVCVCDPRHVCTVVTSFGMLDVGDVEDADAAHAQLADRLGRRLRSRSRRGCWSLPTT